MNKWFAHQDISNQLFNSTLLRLLLFSIVHTKKKKPTLPNCYRAVGATLALLPSPCALHRHRTFATPQSFLHWKLSGGFAFPVMSPVYRKAERRLCLVCLRSFPRRLRIKERKRICNAIFTTGESGDLGFHMTHTRLVPFLSTDFSAVPVATVATTLPFETCRPACVFFHSIIPPAN